jgi:ATP-dependent DNA ligase
MRPAAFDSSPTRSLVARAWPTASLAIRADSCTPGAVQTVSSQIRRQLDTVVSPKSKLTRPIRKPKATWVEPAFYADIEYRDITSEGLLRASSSRDFLGSRSVTNW